MKRTLAILSLLILPACVGVKKASYEDYVKQHYLHLDHERQMELYRSDGRLPPK